MEFIHRIILDTLRPCIILLLAALFYCLSGFAVLAQPVAEQHILLLYAYGYGGRGVELFSDGFFKAITEAGFPVSSVYAEYLDLQRNKELPGYREDLLAMLHKKYGQKRLDLIVTVQQPALDFLITEGKDIAPQAPVITLQHRSLLETEKMGRRIVGEINQFDIKGTLERALELLPDTKRVVFVSGSSIADKKVAEQASSVAEPFRKQLQFEYTVGMTLDEIIEKVASLPPHSIIIFTQYNLDSKGRVALAYEAENMIIKSANAPVFGFYDYNLINGGIGGSVIDVKSSGFRTGQLAIDILNGVPPASPGKLRENENVPMFDWQQIQRWGANVDRLPANTVFINRPPSLWKQYSRIIISTLFFILVQSVLIVFLLVNIRRRRGAEKVLEKSEKRHREYILNAPYGVFVVDEQGRFQQANPAACHMSRYNEQELLSMSIADLLHADSLVEGEDHFQRLVHEGKSQAELLHRLKSGEKRLWSVTAAKISDTLFLGFCDDITERKKAEEALRASEEDLRESQRIAHVGSWRLDVASNQIVWSEELYKMYGFDPKLPPPPYTEHQKLFTPESWDKLSTALQNTRGTGTPYDLELETLRIDGSRGWMWVHGMAVRDARGITIGLGGVAQDITERKKAEQALLASRATLDAALTSMTDAVFISDNVGQFIEFNDAFALFHRFKDKAECSMMFADYPDILEVYMADGKPAPIEMWAVPRALRGEKVTNAEYRLRRKDTGETWVGSYSFGPIRDNQGVIVGSVVVGRDITELKKNEESRIQLESQLQQVQKMEAVGQLAGGVAHDFNNMLGVILGHAEMAMEEVDPAHPIFADLKEIFNAANRSADITRQLLAFARKQTISPKVIDLNATVEGMLKMLRRLIGEDIDLAWMPGFELWEIKADPSQIDQILANLCVNARDAISGIGNISVETENCTFDEEYCSSHANFVPGEYVMLSVSDNGSGMNKKTLARIFEPFFTTKGIGEGTGLGLATVYGVVKQNNGFINVYSEPGQGTIFKVYLPRYKGKSEQVWTEEISKHVVCGHEIILLVEDEQTIMKMTSTMLERLGYSIIAAGTPGEAIQRAEEFSESIELLITDVIMPEMNGLELAEKLQANHPKLKCLFMSGYSANIISKQGILVEGVHFIQKPFSKKDLATKVREALEGASPV